MAMAPTYFDGIAPTASTATASTGDNVTTGDADLIGEQWDVEHWNRLIDEGRTKVSTLDNEISHRNGRVRDLDNQITSLNREVEELVIRKEELRINTTLIIDEEHPGMFW